MVFLFSTGKEARGSASAHSESQSWWTVKYEHCTQQPVLTDINWNASHTEVLVGTTLWEVSWRAIKKKGIVRNWCSERCIAGRKRVVRFLQSYFRSRSELVAHRLGSSRENLLHLYETDHFSSFILAPSPPLPLFPKSTFKVECPFL